MKGGNGTVIPLHVNQKGNLKITTQQSRAKVSPFAASFATLVLLLLCFGMLITLIYFNVGDIGLEVLHLLRTNDSVYMAEQEEIKNTGNNLAAKEDELNLYEKDLKRKENDLLRREDQLIKAEKDLQEKLELASVALDELSSEGDSLQELVEIYRSMEPKTAANIMARHEDEQMIINILKYMKPGTAASILSALNPEIAAKYMAQMGEKEETE